MGLYKCGFLGLASFSYIVFSGFFHVVALFSTSILFMTEYYSMVYTEKILFIHSSVHGHLGYFHLLAIMHNFPANTEVCVFVGHAFIALGYIRKSRIAGSGSNCLTFWGTAKPFCKMVEPFYTPSSYLQGFQFFHIFINTCLLPAFFIIAIQMVAKWGFIVILIFICLMTDDGQHLSTSLLAIGIFSLGKMSIHVFCPSFNWVSYLFVEL